MPTTPGLRQLCLLSALIFVSGCSNKPAFSTPGSNGVLLLPHAVLESREINLGHIATSVNKELEASIRILNQGNSILKLGKISTSCGCTVVKPPNGSIAPGGSESVAIKVKSGVEPGPRQSIVTITTNDPAMPGIELPIRWFIDMPAMFDPTRLDFGKLRPAQRSTRRVALTLKGDLRSASIRAVSDNPKVHCSLSSLDPSSETRIMEIELETDSSFGQRHAGIRLLGDDKDLQAVLPIHWNVEPPFSATPAALFTSRATADEVIERQVVLTSEKDDEFLVENVTSDKKECVKRLSIEKSAPMRHTITIRLQAPAVRGVHRFLFSIAVKSDDFCRVEVPWSIVVP